MSFTVKEGSAQGGGIRASVILTFVFIKGDHSFFVKYHRRHSDANARNIISLSIPEKQLYMIHRQGRFIKIVRVQRKVTNTSSELKGG